MKLYVRTSCLRLTLKLPPTTPLRTAVKTVFEDRMGSMDVPPLLSKHLNTWLPLILVVMCLITALNLWDKIMGMWVKRAGVQAWGSLLP